MKRILSFALITFAMSVFIACVSIGVQAQTYTFAQTFGSFGTGNGLLNLPYDIALDSNDNLYVADGSNNRVVEFSPTGGFSRNYGIGISLASGVAVDANYIYIADQKNNRIEKVDKANNLVLYIGGFNAPQGIHLDSAGNLYVADVNDNRVVEDFNTGGIIQNFGSGPGSNSGQLRLPREVFVDSSGNVYVSDGDNDRIVKFSSTGVFLLSIYGSGVGNGQFTNPRGVGVDRSGNIYVDDFGGNRIVEFTSTGAFVQNIGSGNGQLSGPAGIAFDSQGNLYVADYHNNRAVKFNRTSDATPGTFAGAITLDGVRADALETVSDQNITFDFRPTGGGMNIIVKQVLTPAATDTGTFSIANIPAGTYDVAIKGFCWLQALVPGVTISAASGFPPISITLSNGDLNDDNRVDIADFGLLINNFGLNGDL